MTLSPFATAVFLAVPIAAAIAISLWPSPEKRAHRRQLRALRQLRPVPIPHQRTPEDHHDD